MPVKTHVNLARATQLVGRLKPLSAAIASTLLISNVYAAGLGKLSVLSGLGQPLHAEIEVTSASKEDATALVPKLASADVFQQAGVEFNPALLGLNFKLEQRGERKVIRITSTQPINEPFVDMLVEITGPNSHLVREYTFLLDPIEQFSSRLALLAPAEEEAAAAAVTPAAPPAPTLAAASPAPQLPSQIQPQAPLQPQLQPQPQPPKPIEPVASEKLTPQQKEAAAPAEKSANKEPVAQELALQPKPSPQTAAVISPATAEKSGAYRVKAGESLAQIAAQVKPVSISLDQMLVALYRANPDAFVEQNMNRLRTGSILSIPDAQTVSNIGAGEAKGIVIAQALDFSNYRHKLAGQIATAAPEAAAEAKQSAAGKITTKVQERSPVLAEAKDKLTLSKLSAKNKDNDAAKGAHSTVSVEDVIAKDKALTDANDRIKELEKNLSDLQKLLEVKNKSLAEQQKQLELAHTTASAPASISAPLPAAPAAILTTPPPPQPPASETTAAAGSVADKQVPPPPQNNAAKSAAASAAIKKPQPTRLADESFRDGLTTDNPWVIGGIVAAIVAALGAALHWMRRKKQQKRLQNSAFTEPDLKANSMFGNANSQLLNTSSIFDSNFVPMPNQTDPNEVDPVAEAEVYIAYGRDAQAEEILKEALRSQPTRHAVRVKLLEIYAQRKDQRAFNQLANDLYNLTKGQGDDWRHAADLGRELEPDNPLYQDETANAKRSASTDHAPAGRAAAGARPHDEAEDLEALLAITQLDAQLENLNTIEAARYFPNNKSAASEASSATASTSATSSVAAAPIVNTEVKSAPAFEEKSKEQPAAVNASTVETTAGKPNVASKPAAPSNSIDFDFLKKESAPPIKESTATPPAMDFDFSSINLELENAAEKTPAHNAGSVENVGNADTIPSAHLPNNKAEMATKLDLAAAYQEIGDKEGARELLNEVIKEGGPEQINAAKALLAKLG